MPGEPYRRTQLNLGSPGNATQGKEDASAADDGIAGCLITELGNPLQQVFFEDLRHMWMDIQGLHMWGRTFGPQGRQLH